MWVNRDFSKLPTAGPSILRVIFLNSFISRVYFYKEHQQAINEIYINILFFNCFGFNAKNMQRAMRLR